MGNMLIFLIDEYIYDLENSELMDKDSNEKFEKDKKELIELLQNHKEKLEH